MNKPLRRVISVALALSLSVTLAVNAYAEATANSSKQDATNAGYARKGQYVLFSTGENAMQLNTTKTTVNGNIYAGGDLNAYSGEIDVNGKTVLGGKLYKHDYTVWDSYIFEENADKQSLDNDALDGAFTSMLGEDYLTHEYWYTYSGSEVTGDASIYAKSGLQYCADSVNISGTLISDSYMMISASKAFTTDGEINMCVKNGNVGIYAGEVDIDGVLYDTEYSYETIEEAVDEIVTVGTKTSYNGVYIGEASSSGFLWPAPSCHYISSPYGWRNSGWHNGIDLVKSGGGALGTPVIASKSGRVEVVQRSSSGYGNMVLINHGDGYKTRYAHMVKGSIKVSVGDYVEAGQTIGKVGSTGNSTGPHLHFEVIVNGETRNPKNYIY